MQCWPHQAKSIEGFLPHCWRSGGRRASVAGTAGSPRPSSPCRCSGASTSTLTSAWKKSLGASPERTTTCCPRLRRGRWRTSWRTRSGSSGRECKPRLYYCLQDGSVKTVVLRGLCPCFMFTPDGGYCLSLNVAQNNEMPRSEKRTPRG